MTLKSMICDSHDDDAVSSKRVIALLAFIFCSIAFFANLFFDYTVDEYIFQAMSWIVIGAFGSTAVEKFTSSTQSS